MTLKECMTLKEIFPTTIFSVKLMHDCTSAMSTAVLDPTVQATTAIVDTVIVESTAIVEQKPLTTQFYLLLVESPF